MVQQSAAVPGSKPGNMYRYYILFVMMLTYMFNITDRMVMSILIEDIKADFVLTDTQIGLLAGTAFTLFYVLLGIPAGRLADRTNRKKMISIAVSLWSLMTALCGVATGFWTLFLARLGVGVGEAGGNPPAISILTNYFQSHELSRAMGIFSIGAVLGPVVGFVAGGLLAETYGWRWTFIILGLPGILLGLLIYLTVREPDRSQFAAGDKEKAETQEPFATTMASLWKNRVFTRVALANALAVTASYAFAIWLAPILIRNFEIPVSQVGIYLGLAWIIGGVPSMILGGYLTDWLATRNPKWRAWYCAIVVLLALPLLCLCLLTDNLVLALVLYALGYGVHTSTQGPAIAMMQASVSPTERGTASSIASLSATFLGYFIGPAVAGAMSDRLAPDYGTLSLNYAVIGITILSLTLAILAYLYAARAVPDTPPKAA
ncbi:MFS transporter [Parasphingorhabdus litoris]|uniref:MFS transporter n=1 Tax=Parasphingorhabdus litoris TaxID=394733 RepID=A0ABN1AX46_9SPHN|nr:MFS transporter [Parasphingorhabdus litoris]